MRKTRVPLLALSCFVIALVQAGCVEGYFHGWLNQDIGLGCFLAGGVGAVYMTVYGLTSNGGASPLGWVLLIWINAWVYHMIARLYLWARQSYAPRQRMRLPDLAAPWHGLTGALRRLHLTGAWIPPARGTRSASASAS